MRYMRSVAVGGLLALLLVGCSGSNTTPSATTAGPEGAATAAAPEAGATAYPAPAAPAEVTAYPGQSPAPPAADPGTSPYPATETP